MAADQIFGVADGAFDAGMGGCGGDLAVGRAAHQAMDGGHGGHRVLKYGVYVRQGAPADHRQPSIQARLQAAQQARAPGLRLHVLGQGLDVRQCPVEVEEQRRPHKRGKGRRFGQL